VEGPDKGLSHASAAETITVGTATDSDLRLSDATVSRYHMQLQRRGDRILVLDIGSTNGIGLGQTLIERALVAPGTTLKLGHSSVRVDDGKTVTVEMNVDDSLGGLLGRSPAMRRLMAKIQRAAETEVPVLIVGESGTGKELTARALHDLGQRAKAPFVTVDCGALTPTLIQSELFGHERGAFTGADRRHIGAFEQARGGTLFLDEIGELPAEVQSTLLGALERRVVRRVGGAEEVEIDARVVSATNRDLRAEVNAGAFRLDLFYRLAVVVLEIPPLREHADDIPLLVQSFLEEAGRDDVGAVFPPDTLAALRTHRWPGNVRELRNLVEATLAIGEFVSPASVMSPAASRAEPAVASADAAVADRSYGEARQSVLSDFEKTYLRQIIDRAKGNVSLASRLAHVDRTHLMRLMKRHGIR
jgi:DNA-binding NtrC family response regulator